MNAEELKNSSEEQLLKKKKGLQSVNGILIGLLLVFLILISYDYFKGNEIETGILIMPVLLAASIPFNYKELSKVKAELARREVQ